MGALRCASLQVSYRGGPKKPKTENRNNSLLYVLGALMESRFDFHPFLLHVRGQSSPGASPMWRITTNEGWKVGRMTKPSRKPSRYDREKPYHFEVRMKLWLSRIIFHVWTIELRRWPKVTFQDRCLGFPNHPYFLIFMKMALIYDPLNDIDLFAWGLPFHVNGRTRTPKGARWR